MTMIHDMPSMDSGFFFTPALLEEADQQRLEAEPLKRLLNEVDLFASMEDYQGWYEHLSWILKFDWSQTTQGASGIATNIEKALAKRATQKIDQWSRTVALLSMLVLTSATGYAWSSQLTRAYMGRRAQDFVRAVVMLLNALYQDKAQRAPAGPAAYYWIARVAAMLPGVVAQSQGPVFTYFQWIEHRESGRSRPSEEAQSGDRVLAYLLRRIDDKKRPVAFQHQRQVLSGKEKLRLFFGENKNRWSWGARVRFALFLLSLLSVPVGIGLWWNGHSTASEAAKLERMRKQEIQKLENEFRKFQSRPPQEGAS